MERVDTSIDYGDVHEEGETSTTPDGAESMGMGWGLRTFRC